MREVTDGKGLNTGAKPGFSVPSVYVFPVFPVCMCHLGMLSSTVAHPYRKTIAPTTEAGINIWVYNPNQAK